MSSQRLILQGVTVTQTAVDQAGITIRDSRAGKTHAPRLPDRCAIVTFGSLILAEKARSPSIVSNRIPKTNRDAVTSCRKYTIRPLTTAPARIRTAFVSGS